METNANTWVIVGVAGARYICSTNESSEHVRTAAATREVFTFLDVVELHMQMGVHQDPKDPERSMLIKECIATPLDVTCGTTKSTIDLAGARVTLLNDLQPEDQAHYRALIEQASVIQKAWQEQRSKILRPKGIIL